MNFRVGLKKVTLDFKSIISVQKVGEKVKIESEKGTYHVVSSLNKIREQLPDTFIRINRNTIINSREVCTKEENVEMKSHYPVIYM